VAGWVTTLLVRIKYCGNQDKIEWQVRVLHSCRVVRIRLCGHQDTIMMDQDKIHREVLVLHCSIHDDILWYSE